MREKTIFRLWDKDKINLRKGSKGWYKENGYIMQKTVDHPKSNKRGYVAEHRLVMENHLGRYLNDSELVHHIDQNRENNNISNLKLLDKSTHHKEHITARNSNGYFVASEPIFKELKFRLYDTDKKITQIFTLQELIAKTYRRGKFEFRGRYTGLKDVNGKEIFEGDVYTQGDKNIKYRLIFKNGCFIGNQIGNKSTAGLFHWIKDIEIIGNIYENPDLLT